MGKQIVVFTQHGNCGYISEEFRRNAGPYNFLSATRVAREEIDRNRGVGGYRTWIEVAGTVFDGTYNPFPSSAKEAKDELQALIQ